MEDTELVQQGRGRSAKKRQAKTVEHLAQRLADLPEAELEKLPQEPELAREIGVNPVARALRLDYNRLKRRVTGQNGSQTQASPTPTNPTFVELAVDAVSPRPEWVVEFEGRSGKVTIRLMGEDSMAIAALADALSRTES